MEDYPTIAMTNVNLFLFQIIPYQTGNLAGFGMAVQLELGKEQLAIGRELKATAIRGHQGKRLNIGLELVDQLSYQTGSTIGVVSDSTVNQI